MIFEPDEAIELERRHIREGEARILKQEAILRLLAMRGSPHAAALARELLAEFRDIVEFARKRVVELERHYKRERP
jgi:hypothetical protein